MVYHFTLLLLLKGQDEYFKPGRLVMIHAAWHKTTDTLHQITGTRI